MTDCTRTSSDRTSSEQQFNAQADKYASSEVHRFGASLPVLIEYAAPQSEDVALDVATGTGNTALELAPHVAQVVGLDMAAKMMAHAQKRAAEEGRRNSIFVRGSAEDMPFPDGAFTLVTSRHAPHHFRDAAKFLAEAFRVLKPGGRLVIADQISPNAEIKPWLDEFHTTRDPSHFTQRTVQEWRELTGAAGFTWVKDTLVPYRMDFDWWTQQSGCTPETIQKLRGQMTALSEAHQQDILTEFGEQGELVAHTDFMMVARLERR
ncbi:class I SAM-dependent methyltransferase [Deinococcus antarcticus]|uniref:Class I SAM-dependent methyltransferase n=1 Tax=Deinococcus antarcticus TaxID=1298767 RepID=A0ABV8A9Q5_9DEIO